MTVTGQVDQCSSDNKGMRLYVAMVGYTDGAVVEVKTIKNTTGSNALASANEAALQQALFYPMVDKGTRKTFIYEHRVYY